jgi:hypothetical protein
MGWPDFTTVTPLTEYDADQTLSTSTTYVLVDSTNVSTTITLSDVSNSRARHVIKKIDSTENIVKIQGDGVTIDEEDYLELTRQYSYVEVISDGTEWWIIGGLNVNLDSIMSDILEENKGANANLLEIQKELENLKNKIDRWSAMQYSAFAGEVED